MSVTPVYRRSCACPRMHAAQAQAAIRTLTARGRLSAAERLELAAWQREWVEAWRESRYAIAA